MYTVVTSFYILPKCAKTREPEDEHCVWQYTSIIHTCDPTPLDTPKNHTALPYITWRLVQDTKIRNKESLRLRFFTRQEDLTGNKRPEKYQFNKFYQTAVKDFKSKRKQLHMDKP